MWGQYVVVCGRYVRLHVKTFLPWYIACLLHSVIITPRPPPPLSFPLHTTRRYQKQTHYQENHVLELLAKPVWREGAVRLLCITIVNIASGGVVSKCGELLLLAQFSPLVQNFRPVPSSLGSAARVTHPRAEKAARRPSPHNHKSPSPQIASSPSMHSVSRISCTSRAWRHAKGRGARRTKRLEFSWN